MKMSVVFATVEFFGAEIGTAITDAGIVVSIERNTCFWVRPGFITNEPFSLMPRSGNRIVLIIDRESPKDAPKAFKWGAAIEWGHITKPAPKDTDMDMCPEIDAPRFRPARLDRPGKEISLRELITPNDLPEPASIAAIAQSRNGGKHPRRRFQPVCGIAHRVER